MTTRKDTQESYAFTTDLIQSIPKKIAHMICTGQSGSEQAYTIAHIWHKIQRNMVIIAPTNKMADRFVENLNFYLGQFPPPILFFPSYHMTPFKMMTLSTKTAAIRIHALYQLLTLTSPFILVTTPNALIQKLVPRTIFSEYAELIMINEDLNRDMFVKKLISGGYTHAHIVEEHGDFSVRGGILDIFCPMYDSPLRIEFYGDLVESIRFFSPTTQRTQKHVDEVIITPAREIILQEDLLLEFIHNVRKQALALGLSVSKIRSIIEQIKAENDLSGIEGLISLLYSQTDTFFNYCPSDTLFIMLDPSRIEKETHDYLFKAHNNYDIACDEKCLCVSPESIFLSWDEMQSHMKAFQRISFKLFSTGQEQSHAVFNFLIHDNMDIKTQMANTRHDKAQMLAPLSEWLTTHLDNGFKVFCVCNTKGQVDRLSNMLQTYGIKTNNNEFVFEASRIKGYVTVCQGTLSSGFVWVNEMIALITEEEIFGIKKRKRKTEQSPKIPTAMLSFADLNQGDLVVHVDHGIGQYGGLIKINHNRISNDYIVIYYRDADKLYLPVDRLNMIQKYMGVDGKPPSLDKMGGKSWEKVKERVKKSVEIIAKELLSIYAARKVQKGFSFSYPDESFRDFESGFEYEETTDQIKAINDVLDDMEKETCMDRLVCGDVGYGKTEVALRASFKAVNDGKQVAILVPTTLLCEQHYQTFKKRFDNYPIYIESLNRFRTTKEQRSIIQNLMDGKIDIVIGTHRLLQKDIHFKDIGLIIIDEEQRFGVKHKEKLKRFRNTVDVLTLTATPIPRTLHMSLMGIRDISVISTPPEDRKPITTYIIEFDGVLIAEAIRKEMARKGQIFFLHNNINSITAMAGYLKNLVPEIRLGIAHGRMNETELEKVMQSFIQQKIDLLLCTTIIESGLDIPSANTIIINKADRLGLAQIYQLRGRVGRSEEQAYSYLIIPHESTLGKDAKKRIKVLMEHNDLGEGFRIAMSDLQIRGGGSILGASQSGHIAAVGYEMYLELIERAVEELKGKKVLPPLEPEINITWSVFIPESYIPHIDHRLATYRRISKIESIDEIIEFKKDLSDRYGPIPKEVNNLITNIVFKILAKIAGIKRLELTEKCLILFFSPEHQEKPDGIIDLVHQNPETYQFFQGNSLKITLSEKINAITQTKKILKEIGQRVK